jgi:hypothetical protein
MDAQSLTALLKSVRTGSVSINDALSKLRDLPFTDTGFAKIDHHRALRKGAPEVIFCQNKTPAQVCAIVKIQVARHETVLGTRADRDVLDAVRTEYPAVAINEAARCFWIKAKQWKPKPLRQVKGAIIIATAGTADTPVAEEARCTIELLGHPCKALYDVGVAGIHRLFASKAELDAASVVIAVAGMEGALPSVVAGLVRCPVIGVPTSVGYGSHLGGLVPLFAMLNSCASGLTVVNIDNGFGAGYAAVAMNARVTRYFRVPAETGQ